MELITLFFLAIGLSMDAFAVSLSNGMCYRCLKRHEGISIALTFGFFQGLMPILGYYAGIQFSSVMEGMDHWVALFLLSLIGGKMIWEALKEIKNPKAMEPKAFSYKTLLVQGIATSIDALAVGVSFAVMNVQIYSAALLIAVVTALCCLLGVSMGKKLGGLLKQKAELLGGVILIGIGLKILIEHTL